MDSCPPTLLEYQEQHNRQLESENDSPLVLVDDPSARCGQHDVIDRANIHNGHGFPGFLGFKASCRLIQSQRGMSTPDSLTIDVQAASWSCSS